MSGFIKGDNRQQATLFPERLDDYIAEDNSVLVIDYFIDSLKLKKLGFAYNPKNKGRPGYDPALEMKAKVLSTITVVDERATPELNAISLRRWLMESALIPQALLPGGAVTWEPIDETKSRAVVAAEGLHSSVIAHFDDIGRVTHMSAEEDGDLTTPYHGSGEHVTREDYPLVAGDMVPHKFTFSRAANGDHYPFLDAEIVFLKFDQWVSAMSIKFTLEIVETGSYKTSIYSKRTRPFSQVCCMNGLYVEHLR